MLHSKCCLIAINARYFLFCMPMFYSREIDCQALYIFNQVFGNAAIGFASINLSLRTIALWSQSLYIIIPLVAFILGHWSLLLHGLLISAAWTPAGCAITKTDNTILAATFIYSMCLDFLVLCLNAYKLLYWMDGYSRLAKLVFCDGLIFFIVALVYYPLYLGLASGDLCITRFLANLLATTFMLLNLNVVMSIMFNVPAAIASTIVASRAVIRLTEFATKGPEAFLYVFIHY